MVTYLFLFVCTFSATFCLKFNLAKVPHPGGILLLSFLLLFSLQKTIPKLSDSKEGT